MACRKITWQKVIKVNIWQKVIKVNILRKYQTFIEVKTKAWFTQRQPRAQTADVDQSRLPPAFGMFTQGGGSADVAG